VSVGEWLQVGVIFCFNSKSCEGHSEVAAVPFLVTIGEDMTIGFNYVCIIHIALHMA
jgi:hypothetical protein